MWFVVNFRDGLSPRVDEFPHVILIQDNWDDYGYQTTFESGLRLSADETIDLGNVKILKIVRRAVIQRYLGNHFRSSALIFALWAIALNTMKNSSSVVRTSAGRTCRA